MLMSVKVIKKYCYTDSINCCWIGLLPNEFLNRCLKKKTDAQVNEWNDNVMKF